MSRKSGYRFFEKDMRKRKNLERAAFRQCKTAAALFANFDGERSGYTQSYAATGGFRAAW
jgi:hypothetical protein